jgi:hypothetical protein
LADAVRRLEALPLRHRRVVLRLVEAALDDLEGIESPPLPARPRKAQAPRGPRPFAPRRRKKKTEGTKEPGS